MTSYHEKNGRMVPDKLPEDFGQKIALRQSMELQHWAHKQRDKFRQCGVCNVPIRASEFERHVAETHTTAKDESRARALRR